MVAGVGAFALVAAAAVIIVRTADARSYPVAWDPRVVPIAQFVQSERGLLWDHPVKVDFLSPQKFDTLMAKENSPRSGQAQGEQWAFDAMRAIGVASGHVDLAKSNEQLAQADVVGEYVDSDRTVYVRGDRLTPYVRSVLAHELTHALQAQYFNLDKMTSGHADDDSAVTALIEGDAVRVQDAYERTLSQADQSLLAQEEGQLSDKADSQTSQDQIPQFMIDQAQFPYDFGPTFVAALVANGGNSEVDAAFRDPPILDGQIVDPDTYTLGAAPPQVVLPALPKGATPISPPSGFGEISLVEMLGDRIGFSPAWSAVQGWMRDETVPYRQDGRVCVDVAVLDDSRTSATTLAQAGRGWASELPAASVRQSGDTVDFQACDPGAGWKPARTAPDPYQVLATRSALIYQLITDGHFDTTTSTCAADQVLTAIGPQALQEMEQTNVPNSPALEQLTRALKSAIRDCA